MYRPRNPHNSHKNPGSRNAGTSLCVGEAHPSKPRICSGQAPGFLNAYFVGCAWREFAAEPRPLSSLSGSARSWKRLRTCAGESCRGPRGGTGRGRRPGGKAPEDNLPPQGTGEVPEECSASTPDHGTRPKELPPPGSPGSTECCSSQGGQLRCPSAATCPAAAAGRGSGSSSPWRWRHHLRKPRSRTWGA